VTPIEKKVRHLMILQSQINVLYLDLCLSKQLGSVMKLNEVYEDISNFLIRRIGTDHEPFDIDELIRDRLREICLDDYLDALYARVDRALAASPGT
jgi:hypothetical protein